MEHESTALENWIPFGSAETSQLIDARLQLHHAAQLASAPGSYLMEPRADYSHTSFYWDRERQSLVGESIGDIELIRVGLRPRDLSIIVIEEQSGEEHELQLNEISFGEALFWIETQLEELGINVDAMTLEPPADMPEHPVGDGKPFKYHNPVVFEELSAFFSNSDILLQQVAKRKRNASVVRCWPHHFDIATLLTVKSDPDPELSKTIGIGLSPGDATFPAPYFYVTPWPYPDLIEVELPPLVGGGEWYIENWIGAVLHSRHLQRLTSGQSQFEQASLFITNAIETVQRLLK